MECRCTRRAGVHASALRTATALGWVRRHVSRVRGDRECRTDPTTPAAPCAGAGQPRRPWPGRLSRIRARPAHGASAPRRGGTAHVGPWAGERTVECFARVGSGTPAQRDTLVAAARARALAAVAGAPQGLALGGRREGLGDRARHPEERRLLDTGTAKHDRVGQTVPLAAPLGVDFELIASLASRHGRPPAPGRPDRRSPLIIHADRHVGPSRRTPHRCEAIVRAGRADPAGRRPTPPARLAGTVTRAWRVLAVFAGAHFLPYLFRSANSVIAGDLTARMGLSPGAARVHARPFLGSFALGQLPFGRALARSGGSPTQPRPAHRASSGRLGGVTPSGDDTSPGRPLP